MKKEQVKALKQLLDTPKNVVVIPHKNPDGDAMGSTLALCHYLNSIGHKSLVISPNAYPDFLAWMPGQELVILYNSETQKAKKLIQNADLIFTLDFNALSRTGEMEETLKAAKATFVMIDHHQQPDDYAQFMYSDPTASSTCELVYNFMEKMDALSLITPKIANCLYAGIMTDTGSFRFPSTTSHTHSVIANLIDKGADNSKIHQEIFDSRTKDQLKLLGVALNNLKVFENLRTAYITLTQKELDDNNFKKGDTEGFVNYGLSLKGIVFAAIFIENADDQIIKISFRSKGDFDVNTFARLHFYGGGHINAAGGRSHEHMEETLERFETLLIQYKNQLQSS